MSSKRKEKTYKRKRKLASMARKRLAVSSERNPYMFESTQYLKDFNGNKQYEDFVNFVHPLDFGTKTFIANCILSYTQQFIKENQAEVMDIIGMEDERDLFNGMDEKKFMQKMNLANENLKRLMLVVYSCLELAQGRIPDGRYINYYCGQFLAEEYFKCTPKLDSLLKMLQAVSLPIQLFFCSAICRALATEMNNSNSPRASYLDDAMKYLVSMMCDLHRNKENDFSYRLAQLTQELSQKWSL